MLQISFLGLICHRPESLVGQKPWTFASSEENCGQSVLVGRLRTLGPSPGSREKPRSAGSRCFFGGVPALGLMEHFKKSTHPDGPESSKSDRPFSQAIFVYLAQTLVTTVRRRLLMCAKPIWQANTSGVIEDTAAVSFFSRAERGLLACSGLGLFGCNTYSKSHQRAAGKQKEQTDPLAFSGDIEDDDLAGKAQDFLFFWMVKKALRVAWP